MIKLNKNEARYLALLLKARYNDVAFQLEFHADNDPRYGEELIVLEKLIGLTDPDAVYDSTYPYPTERI